MGHYDQFYNCPGCYKTLSENRPEDNYHAKECFAKRISKETCNTIIDRQQYERDLKERQKRHLEQVGQNNNRYWQPCLHDQCSDCHGTGIKLNGGICVHHLSCPCPKCTPTCMAHLE